MKDSTIVFDTKKEYDDFISRINGTYEYTNEKKEMKLRKLQKDLEKQKRK
mgnify:CR=1 FL=1